MIVTFGKFLIKVYHDVKWHDGQWRYGVGLLLKGEYYTGDPWDLCYPEFMTREMVTEWMNKVQSMENDPHYIRKIESSRVEKCLSCDNWI